MIKKIKPASGLLYLTIIVIVILMLIFGKKGGEDIEALEKELGLGESTGSGFLEVDTFPGNAEIYVDGILRGVSPDTLYNIPAGMHEVVIKKEGYEDYITDVNVGAGKKAFIEADLVAENIEGPKAAEERKTVDTEEVIGEAGPISIVEEEDKKEKLAQELGDLEGKNIINIGEKLQFYYDFSDERFTGTRHPDSDVFSRRFDTYLVFTRFSPVNIKTVNKKIEDANREDCINVAGTFEYLYSGRSLCIVTKEGKIAAIGGYWENTENAELIWKVFD